MQHDDRLTGHRPLTSEEKEALEEIERKVKDPVCPFGSRLGACDVFCAIEGNPIEARTSPTSVLRLCHGEYTECTSLRRYKDKSLTQAQHAKQEIRKADKERDEMAALAAGEPI